MSKLDARSRACYSFRGSWSLFEKTFSYVEGHQVTVLDDIHRQVHSCVDCALAQNRTLAVPGDGSSQAKVMFVGEGPGAREDRQGLPFVGPAGQFLNELLASVGLERKDVFITNLVKCRPPNNRDPFPGEIAACGKYLDDQIRFIQPNVVVPLGRHALARWFPSDTIGKVRARPRLVDGVTIFPLYHPAAALHNQGLRVTIEQDFLALGKLLKQHAACASPEVSETAGEQLSMF